MLQNRCANMLAHLFHAPVGDDETAVGVGTVGSSEAIMLAGLAFKRKWQAKRKAEGKPFDKPNILTGANVQVCWEKIARYFEVELKEVKLKEGYYVMDPAKAVEMVDENTICITTILGSTLTGEFEDVKLLNELLTKKNKETGWDTPIHVDAANLEWDFRLPLVKCINVNGHKSGLVYAGVDWVIWQSSYQIIAQYYQLIRLGFEGYKSIMENCIANAKVLTEGIKKMGRDSSKYTLFEVPEHLRRFGWIVPAYVMPPDAEHIAVLRVVIREDFSHSLAERLVSDIEKILSELEKQPPRLPTKAARVTAAEVHNDKGDGLHQFHTDIVETQKDIIKHWRRIDWKKTSGVC
ncbi:hypothetical protein K7X08_035502 [Anisodus acutangulus]|uniref:glutamate decarboxylase n=1 Tax=Anisodus acutangulus TaxID=402998 RepID=A0A9Q1LKV3_9SOLA|nr:hypothetical protein K7X08_035502 [Anisodus acutangulus]